MRAKVLLFEGKTIMNWNDAETSVSKQFTMRVADVLVLFSLATGNGVRGVVAAGGNDPAAAAERSQPRGEIVAKGMKRREAVFA